MRLVSVTYVGPELEYSSSDGAEHGRGVHLRQGESGEVTEAKARQLGEDFPHWFEIDGKPAAESPSPRRPGPSAEELAELNAQEQALRQTEAEEAAEDARVAEAEAARLAEEAAAVAPEPEPEPEPAKPEPKPLPDPLPATHAELDKLAKKRKLTWPEGTKTVADKHAALTASS